MSKAKKLTDKDLELFFSQLQNRDLLSGLNQRLMDMRSEGRLTLHHYLMELLVSDDLYSEGCTEVNAEYYLGENTRPPNLVIDVYGKSSRMTVGVEIETGHAPTNAIKPNNFIAARTIAKVTRYSPYVDHFSLGLPPTYRPFLMPFFFN